MPIDTQTKRRGVQQLAPLTIAPVPDGTIGAADRQQAANVYPGILSGSPPSGFPTYLVLVVLDE